MRSILFMLLMLCAATGAVRGADFRDFRFVDNGQIRIGVKMSSGAAIAWLSRSADTNNILNHFDRGRLIQQSYYGADDDSMWSKKPWRWNPVQGGDWKGEGSKVLAFTNLANRLYARTLPKHWASGADLTDTSMEMWITLHGPVARVKYRFTYTGTNVHPKTDHEIPAVFMMSKYETLVLYDGKAPWTAAPVSRSVPGWPNEGRKMTENWAAFVDGRDFGAGVYVPIATRLTCYRFGKDPQHASSCSYFAPLTRFAIEPGTDFQYELFLTVGTSTDIRNRFAQIAAAAKRREQVDKTE